ncbi:MAG: histidine kinase [Rhodospirillales bacterium]|nr:histidine kinase [Rhodospirillales bacterium]
MRSLSIARLMTLAVGSGGIAAVAWLAVWRVRRKAPQDAAEKLIAEIAERRCTEDRLKAVNRTLQTLNRCNEALVRASEERELVESICRILVEDGGIRMAWVGYMEANAAQTIRIVAHAGFEDGYLDRINVAWGDVPSGHGPAGIAIRTGRPSWTEDILTDGDFEPWRAEALKRGYAATLSLPLISDGTAFGAITLYADRARAFDAQTRSHFAELANDLAYGVIAIRTRADRERVQEELRRSEAYLEEGQRLTHTGSWAWNVATRENVYWSPEHFRIFGLDPSKDTLSFENAVQRIPPEDGAAFMQAIDAAIREKREFEVDLRILHPDGNVRYLHSVGHPVTDKNNDVAEFVGTLVDVTEQYHARAALERENAERRRAEDELRRSEAFLAEGQRISRTGSWAWNVTTGKTSWSVEHFRILGLDPDTATPSYGMFRDRIHPEDRPAFDEMLQKTVRDGSDFEHDFRIVTPGGTTKYVHSLGHLSGNGAGTTEFIGTVMDITDRKLGEEALRNAVADLERVARLTTIGQLTASIAHEINQPLAAIVTNSSACLRWLEGSRLDLDEARLSAKRIIRDGHRAGDIVRSIRALARKSTPDMRGLDINDVIREVVALMRTELHRNDVLIETDLAEGLGPVLGDRVQLQQVMLNLIMNGIEAMSTVSGRPRLLAVRSRIEERDLALIAVEDSGAGLSPETATRIFEAFFTTKPEGLGMGLSICRSIIDLHGGRLWALPRLPQGSVFQFTLPAATEAPSRIAAQP